jgi:hypothetical protein
LFYYGGARFCSIRAVQGFVLFGRCKVLFYLGGATVSGLGMCKSVSIKSAVQKKAVGGAKNGGRGLEKKPTPVYDEQNYANYALRYVKFTFL